MDTRAFAAKCEEAEDYLLQKGALAFWSTKRSAAVNSWSFWLPNVIFQNCFNKLIFCFLY